MSGLPGNGHSFKGAESYRGGTRYHVFTAGMGTAAQGIKLGGGGRLCMVTNTGGSAQTSSIAYYDAVDTSLTGAVLLCTITPGATTSQANPTPIDIPFINGLVAVASSAITGTVLTGYV